MSIIRINQFLLYKKEFVRLFILISIFQILSQTRLSIVTYNYLFLMYRGSVL